MAGDMGMTAVYKGGRWCDGITLEPITDAGIVARLSALYGYGYPMRPLFSLLNMPGAE